MDVLPRLSEVEGYRANAVAVRCEFDGEVASCARVKKDALSMLPTNFTGLLTQVGEDLIEIGCWKSGCTVSAGLERLSIKLCVDDDRAAGSAEAYVRFHPWHECHRICVRGGHLPLDNRSTDGPLNGTFVPVKIQDKVFEKSRKAIPEEVAKAAGATVLSREPVLVDKLADMQQESVNAVVAVKLDAPKVICAKLDALNRCKPPKQVMHVGTCGGIQFLRFTESLKCGLQDAIRHGVVFEFIPYAGSAALAEQIAPQSLGDE